MWGSGCKGVSSMLFTSLHNIQNDRMNCNANNKAFDFQGIAVFLVLISAYRMLRHSFSSKKR